MKISYKLKQIIEKPWWSFAGFALACFALFGLTGEDIWGFLVSFEWIIDASKWSLIGGAFIFGVSAHAKAKRSLIAVHSSIGQLQTRFHELQKKFESSNYYQQSKFPLPDWLTGEDVMRTCDVSHNQLMQHIDKGLQVYPRNTGDESPPSYDTPPMNEADLGFNLNQDDSEWKQEIEKDWFKKEDIEQFIQLQSTATNDPDLFPNLNETTLKKHIALASSHCPFEKDINHIYLFEGTPFRHQLVVIGKNTKDFDGVKNYWDRSPSDIFENHFKEVYQEEPERNYWKNWNVIVVSSLNEIPDDLALKKFKWVLY